MYTHASTDGRISCYEGATAFYLVNTTTDEEVCLGDGVDMFFYDGIYVGTPEFYVALTDAIDNDTQEFINAYFPEQ